MVLAMHCMGSGGLLKKAKNESMREAKITVSDTNVGKAALRLLSQRLVSVEVAYVQRVLGNTASQADLDAQVLAVRRLPWASIVAPE
jgi:hypothetical protein